MLYPGVAAPNQATEALRAEQDVQQHGQHDRGQDRDQNHREATEGASERTHLPLAYAHFISAMFA